jgi:large repetitive protein
MFIVLGCSMFSFSQIKTPFTPRFNDTFHGDLTMISNNIVSKTPTSTAYNTFGSETNDVIDMQFIDIDGDVSTYNSSSATLNIDDPTCSQIVYAGLYWSATYRYFVGNNPASERFEDWNTVKFKVPGGDYINVTATNVLYNGFVDSNQTGVEHGPYSCYADVTSLMTQNVLPNPNGSYYVGNIRVSRDGRSSINSVTNPYAIIGGVSGGWSLVVIYKNVLKTAKHFTTFDGHAVISNPVAGGQNTSLDIPVSGFKTIPFGPVKAKFGVVALEGDNAIRGDGFSIKANSITNFSNLTYSPTLGTAPTIAIPNYFNSTITLNGQSNTARNPASLNTLGWDSHLNLIPNPSNNVLPNNETGATLRATSTQDKYDVFFTSFDIEIIEPVINLINKAVDLAGNNIANQSLNLGDAYFYDLSFNNSGNDDAQNFTIIDELPKNIIFPPNGVSIQPGDLILPVGVTYTFDSVIKKFVFTIPNSLVIRGGVTSIIRIKVKVKDNCSELIDACSNVIINQAFYSYSGVINPEQITNNPSATGFSICSVPTPGAAIFIANIDQCIFSENTTLCANSQTTLTAPNGYSNYQWSYNGNIITTNQQILTVSDFGDYTVTMTIPHPCVSITKTFSVIDCTLTNIDFDKNDFVFYPNPVKNNLSLSAKTIIDNVEISSVLGQIVLSKKVNALQTEINTSELTNGVYFVKVTSEGKEKTVKIVKE